MPAPSSKENQKMWNKDKTVAVINIAKAKKAFTNTQDNLVSSMSEN